MRPYEVMVIFDADLDEETIRGTVEQQLKTLESKGAERGYVDFWGKRRLAYEIKHRTEGYYVVFQVRSEPPPMDELHRSFSLADEVVRHKVLRIPEKVYGPPRHLSVAPDDGRSERSGERGGDRADRAGDRAEEPAGEPVPDGASTEE